jgi:hypothetical protein
MDRRSIRRRQLLAVASLALVFAPAATDPSVPPPRPVIVAAPTEGTRVVVILERAAVLAETHLVPGTTLEGRVDESGVHVGVGGVDPAWSLLCSTDTGTDVDPEVFTVVADGDDLSETPHRLVVVANDTATVFEAGPEPHTWTVPEPVPASSTDPGDEPAAPEGHPAPPSPEPGPTAPEPDPAPEAAPDPVPEPASAPEPVASAPSESASTSGPVDSPVPTVAPAPIAPTVAGPAPVTPASLFAPRVSGNVAVRQQDDLSPLTPATGTNSSGSLTGAGGAPAPAGPADTPAEETATTAVPTGPLASTGTDAGGPAGAGLVSVLGGLVLVGLARRRTR